MAEEKNQTNTIYFYTTRGDYGCFSNFSKHSFELDGKHWPTNEHYFQAQKFAGSAHEEDVRNAPSPKEAAKRGRDRSRPLRSDWEEVKDDIMRQGIKAKFTQNPSIREILLDTGEKQIIEKTTRDYYWGCGTDGTGKNMLGILLMKVREELRSEDSE